MIRRALPALAAAVALGATLPARAEFPPEFMDRPIGQLARDAFATDYGKLLVAEFGRILHKSADPECLSARGIRPESLEAAGRELLLRNGTAMYELFSRHISREKFEAALAKRWNKNYKAEFARLRAHPDVKKYIALEEPARFAKIADQITENVDRHALLKRLRLVKRLSPLASGDEALLRASPEEKAIEAADKYAETSKSPSLKRWLELQLAVAESYKESLDTDSMMRFGPVQFTPHVEEDLGKLCVFARDAKPAAK